MRFAFALLVAAQCVTLVVSVKTSPYEASGIFPSSLLDRLTDTERSFIAACHMGKLQTITDLLGAVDADIANTEYVKAFFSDRPNVVRALLERGVDGDAANLTFPTRAADHLRARARHGRKYLDQFTPVPTTDQSRSQSQLDSYKKARTRRDFENQQRDRDEDDEDNRQRNVMMKFSYHAALLTACGWKDPFMVSALLSSPLAKKDTRIEDCYRKAIPRKSLGSRFRAADQTNREPNSPEALIRTLLATGRGDVTKLLIIAMDAKTDSDFNIILDDPRVDTDARAELLRSALEKKATPTVMHLLKLYGADILGEPERRGAILAAAVGSSDAGILDALLAHVSYSMLEEKDRRVVLSALCLTYDSEWIQHAILRMNVPIVEAVREIKREIEEAYEYNRHSLQKVLDKLPKWVPAIENAPVDRPSSSSDGSRFFKNRLKNLLPSTKQTNH